MKANILTVLLLCLCFPCFAQKENNIWAFGTKDGLDFNSGSPVKYVTEMFSAEPAAAVCDPSGKMIFYTDGAKVYNKLNLVMPNGSGLTADRSSTQGVVIAPFQKDTNEYFVFCINGYDSGGYGYLRYSVMDRRRNGGLGDIDPARKNIRLDSNLTEKMTLVAGDNCDYWLLVHTDTPAAFHAFHLDASGITTTPVISKIGAATHQFSYYVGEMKVSPDTKLLALAKAQEGTGIGKSPYSFELYDFDNKTGKVSNLREIDTMHGMPWGFYGVEFSGDSKKLYYSNGGYEAKPTVGIVQYDLSLLPDLAAVRASAFVVSADLKSMGLRRAVNGKIYACGKPAGSSDPIKLSCIDDPDGAGTACNFIKDIGLTLNNMAWTFGTDVPAFNGTITKVTDTVFCSNEPYITIIADTGYAAYLWDDGDTARAKNISSSMSVTVSLIRTPGQCRKVYHQYNVVLKRPDTLVSSIDTQYCFVDRKVIYLPDTLVYYRWNDGSAADSAVFEAPGKKWVHTSADGCSIRIDTFKVGFINFGFSMPDTVLCNQQSIRMDAPVADHYLWSDGSEGPGITITKGGPYWLEAAIAHCALTDTFMVQAVSTIVDIGPDQRICAGTKTTLRTGIRDGFFKWQDASADSVMEASESGTYYVAVTRNGCTATDTAKVDVVQCARCISIPNAFSPNSDTRNDVFRPLVSCPTLHYSLKIFNRYGEQIFMTENPAQHWDGTVQHKDQETGVYFYLVKVRFDHPGAEEELFKGDITLLR